VTGCVANTLVRRISQANGSLNSEYDMQEDDSSGLEPCCRRCNICGRSHVPSPAFASPLPQRAFLGDLTLASKISQHKCYDHRSHPISHPPLVRVFAFNEGAPAVFLSSALKPQFPLSLSLSFLQITLMYGVVWVLMGSWVVQEDVVSGPYFRN